MRRYGGTSLRSRSGGCQKMPVLPSSARRLGTTLVNAIVSRWFLLRNAAHCLCLTASVANASLRPTGADEGSAIFRRAKVASMARRSSDGSTAPSFKKYPQIEVVLHAGIGHAQQTQGMEFFCDNGALRIGAQLCNRQVVEQGGIADRFRRRRDGIAEADIDLQCDPCAVELGEEIDSYAAIAGFLADLGTLDRRCIEHDAIVDRDPADVAERRNGTAYIVGTKAQQVDIAGGPMRLRVPK